MLPIPLSVIWAPAPQPRGISWSGGRALVANAWLAVAFLLKSVRMKRLPNSLCFSSIFWEDTGTEGRSVHQDTVWPQSWEGRPLWVPAVWFIVAGLSSLRAGFTILVAS